MTASASAVRPASRIGAVPVAFVAIWAAIVAVVSVVPAIPLVGGGTFGGQEFILSVPGVLFGPVGGAVSAGVGGFIASFIAPGTAYFGLLTFYPQLLGALAAGLLVMQAGWARLSVLGALVVLGAAWPLIPPFSTLGRPIYASFAYWPMYVTAIPLIFLAPWAVRKIRTYRFGSTLVGMAVIAWPAYMVNHVALSLGYSALYPEGPDQWVFAFWSGIVPLQRVLLVAGSSVVATALAIALHRAGISFGRRSGSVLDGSPAAPAGSTNSATR